MKKILLLALALIIAVCLVACGSPTSDQAPATDNSSDPQVSPEAKTAEEPAEEPEELKPEDLPEREGLQFRTAKWTDDEETVKAYETAEFLEAVDENTLAYSGEVAGLSANIYYLFDSEYGLYQGIYALMEKYTSELNYISDYDKLKAALSTTYGEPLTDEIIPIDSLAEYADDIEDLKLGLVIYATEWEINNTKITLSMSSQNYKIITGIYYQAADFTPPPDTSGI